MSRSLLLFCFTLVGALHISSGNSRRIPQVCSKGQVYWCRNITTAAECGAVKHCIQSVWEQERPIEVDRSEICQTCLNMVKQARDQLLSNQTEEEIKEVLEGTCKLMPIKIIREECIKVMDQFGPELVDTLASQMDPQVVCSVAGLCDNSRVHRIEAQYQKQMESEGKMKCADCYTVVDVIGSKFNQMSPNDFLNILAKMCGKLGSYSDSCFSIAVKEHVQSLSWLREKFQSGPVCNLAGICRIDSRRFVPLGMSELNVRTVKGTNGDLPCELCIQLVQHLRDILVANTTEADFELVLKGICNQMSLYKDECLNLVSQYYDTVYKFLIVELDGKMLCQEIKMCPTQSSSDQFMKPLLLGESAASNTPMQLPVTRYNPLIYVPASFIPNQNSNGQTMCSMCEFFLHFVQQEITLPSTENKIKLVVEKGCVRLPSSISDQCRAFIDTYMDEFVALLAQEIDPSQVCPMLGVCPRGLVAVAYSDKPDCPLCLLAFQELNSRLRTKNKTINIINDEIDDLCIRDQFPNSLSMECVGFITQHRQSIVDMLLTEFTPQESCAYIELCIPSELIPKKPDNPVGDIYTNEIRQNPDVEDPNVCVLCEFIMTKISSMLKDKKTEEEIKNVVFHVCDYLPRTVTPKCRQFITQYADLVIELLAQEVDPKQVCTAIDLCPSAQALVKASVEKCLVCELLMDSLRTVLTDPNVDDDINKQLKLACRHNYDPLFETCYFFANEMAPQIESALRTLPVGPLVCRRIMACDRPRSAVRTIPSKAKCAQGSSFWCVSSAHAALCNAIDYCQQEVWKGPKPKKGHLKGRVVISY